jgi:hypothetical protein
MTELSIDAAPVSAAGRGRAAPTRILPGGNRLALFCLVAVVAFGTYVRVWHLGRADFGTDELYQVFAAAGLRQHGDLIMPSGNRYGRGADVTHMIRIGFDIASESAAAARMPSALFGVAGLLLFVAILWSIAGPWVAVAGGLLLAFYPEAVKQSREVRFYTYQAVWGVAALYTGWKALPPPAPGTALMRVLIRGWTWAGLTLLLLAMAVRVQLVSFSVLLAWGAAAVLIAVLDVRRVGRHGLQTSVPAQLAFLGVAAALLVALGAPGWVANLWQAARSVPPWILTAEGGLHPLFYYHVLAATYPALLAALPVLLVGALLLHPRLALFAVAWYGVPLLLHSFVFSMKGERFVMIPALGLFLLAGLGIVYWGKIFARTIYTTLIGSGLAADGSRRISQAVVAAAAIFAVLATPALHRVWDLPGGEPSRRWSSAAQLLADRPELASLPLGSTLALHALYYFHRLDFALSDPTTYNPDLMPQGIVVSSIHGERERDTGVPFAGGLDEVRGLFPDAAGVILAIEERLVRIGRVDPAFMRALAADGVELCEGRCPGLLLYILPFDNTPEEP